MNIDPGEHVPPVDHDFDTFEPRSRWPFVVGTISILYASFGLFFMCISLTGIFLGPWLQASLGGMEPVPMPMVLMIGQVVLVLAGVSLGILLLVGGISTLKRRRRGPRCINLWVVLRLAVLVVGLAFLFMTIDVNLQYQDAVRDSVVELMEKNNVSQEQIDASVPELDPAELRSTMITWSLAFAAMVAVCPIVLGLIMSSKGIRAEWQQWP